MILKLLNTTSWNSWFVMKLYFFLPQTAQFDKSIIPFCLVLLKFEFSFAVFSLQPK